MTFSGALRNGLGVVVGYVEEDWLVLRDRDQAIHRLPECHGWPVDENIIECLRSFSYRGVRMHLTDGRVLQAKTKLWEKAYLIAGEVPRLALPEGYWRDVSPGRKVKEFQGPKPDQLGMWGKP